MKINLAASLVRAGPSTIDGGFTYGSMHRHRIGVGRNGFVAPSLSLFAPPSLLSLLSLSLLSPVFSRGETKIAPCRGLSFGTQPRLTPLDLTLALKGAPPLFS